MSKAPRRLYEFGPFRLDTAERLLLRRGKLVPLPHTAFDVLLVLVEKSGHLVDKETLLQKVWSGTSVEEANLAVAINKLRAVLGDDAKVPRYIETVHKHGYRFIARVRQPSNSMANRRAEQGTQPTISSEAEASDQGQQDAVELAVLTMTAISMPGLKPADAQKPGPAGGALPLSSKFYIVRPTDEQFHSAIASQDSIVLVKGARQVGKTSLLARGLHHARQAGAKIIFTDFQSLNSDYLGSIERLLLAFAESIADQLDLEVSPAKEWNTRLTPSSNFDRYLRREVFVKVPSPIVWGLDEVDRLFSYDLAGEIFGLFRSWHNRRAIDPPGSWDRFTLAIAYATEAHLFITDLNQSPFNVGTRLLLEDFTLEQVAEFNRRFDSPLSEEELTSFFSLVGGQSYLAHKGLHEMAIRGINFTSLEAEADRDEGPFGDHLRRMLVALRRDAELCEAVRGVLRGQSCPTLESFYRLRSAGVIVGDSPSQAKPRCGLYARYLERHLY